MVTAIGLLGLGAAVRAGDTAGLAVPASVAQRTGTSVVGGVPLLGRTDTFAGDGRTITSVLLQLKGPLTLRTVTAAFSGAPVACTKGSYNALTDRTPVTCGVFAQDSRRSATLTVTVV